MKRLRITLEGKSYEVTVEDLSEAAPSGATPPPAASVAVQSNQAAAATAVAPQPLAAAGAVVCPMAGVVLRCLVKPGDVVAVNQAVMVLDAMKMETQIHAPAAGVVRSVLVKQGETVDEGQALLQIDGGAR